MADPNQDNLADALAALAGGANVDETDQQNAEAQMEQQPPQQPPSLIPARPQKPVRPVSLPNGYLVASAPKARPSAPSAAPVQDESSSYDPSMQPQVFNPAPPPVRSSQGATLALSPEGGTVEHSDTIDMGLPERTTTPLPPGPPSGFPVTLRPMGGATPQPSRAAIPSAPTIGRNQPPVAVPSRPPQMATADTPAPVKPKLPKGFKKSLEFKRTVIPICLTMGLMLPFIGIGGACNMLGDELYDAFGKDMQWAVWILGLSGLVLLGLGGANMYQVSQMLEKMRKLEAEARQMAEGNS